jgi:hypothetical protein
MSKRQLEWTPPPRPDWVQKINDEGACMNIRGVVPLDAASLLHSAMAATGQSDFGADDWREPFEVLVKSFDEEAELNLLGRIRTRSELLQLLEARLLIEETYKRHPEIENEIIARPVFVVGQGRSGTSFLQMLLAADPDNGVLTHWEAMFPCPPPEAATYLTDPRIERCHKAIDQWNRVTPTLAAMHEFAGHIPMEDCQVLALDFKAPSWFGSLGQAPSYDAYMVNVSPDSALRYHKRVLKLLQWKNPRKRWVLKDPMHIDRIEALLKVYPDACLVWPHRDPVKVMASVVSLLGTIQWGRSDHPFKGGSFEYVLDPSFAAARLNAVIDRLEAGVLPDAQLFNLQYADLVAKPLAVVEQLYNHFGFEFLPRSRDAVIAYLNANPRDARPAHKTERGSADVIAYEREVFARYQSYFNVASE